MVKVLQVLTDTNFGGAGAWLLNYLRSFDRSKYAVTVVLPYGSVLKSRIEALGIKVAEADGIADCSFSSIGVRELKRLMREIKPDIVHTHAGLSARIAAKSLGIKTVNTRHCIEEKKRFPKSTIYKIINNFLSDAVIGVSNAVAENLADDGIPKKKLHLIYNGIFPLEEISDEKKAELRKSLGFSEDDIIVGIVARLEPVKGHETFLKAAKCAAEKNKNVKFLIVGTGSRETELKNMAKRLGISDKTVFTGYIENVNDINNIIDISVLTSVREALSLSVIEAMSLKKPAVVTDCGGTAEVVSDEKSGFVVKVGDFDTMAEKILTLAENSELKDKMGAEGQKIVGEKFTVQAMAEKIENLYDEILK